MMNGHVLLCILVTALTIFNTEQFVVRNVDTIYEDKCLTTDWKWYDIGEVWYDDTICSMSKCHEKNGVIYEIEHRCPKVRAPPPCRVIKGDGGHFPDCCLRVVCDFQKKARETINKNVVKSLW